MPEWVAARGQAALKKNIQSPERVYVLPSIGAGRINRPFVAMGFKRPLNGIGAVTLLGI